MCGLETQIDRFDRLHIGHVKIFDKFIKKTFKYAWRKKYGKTLIFTLLSSDLMIFKQ